MALTIKEIENAKAKAKKYKMLDGGGLSLLVLPTGTKLWLWRYQFNGSEKNMTFGEYPLVGPKDARELHFAAKKLLATGINPMAERKAEAEAKQQEVRAVQREVDSSFETVARKWWAWWSIGKSPRHAETLMNRLEADVFPAIGHLSIDAVQTAHIRDIMLAIETRGASDVAKRAHQSIGQIFRFAIARELASRNPAADFRPRDVLAATESENFAHVDEKDLPELLAKMDDYNGDALTRFGLKLLAYCFPRTSELIEAPWTEFDLDRARWDIPAERMKMKTPHIIPLSRQAVEVLRALKLLTGNGKSYFCNFILQNAQKYAPLTFIFDIGGSFQSLTTIFGGSYLNVGQEARDFTINPFSLPFGKENLQFLFSFFRVLIEGTEQRYRLDLKEERKLWDGIERMYMLEPDQRTVSNFGNIIGELKERLYRWTRGGQYGFHLCPAHPLVDLGGIGKPLYKLLRIRAVGQKMSKYLLRGLGEKLTLFVAGRLVERGGDGLGFGLAA